ncbi:hypothetical protein ACWDTT_35925 [Streptosporangium sandarakinum]|uniref:Uncharacterized protein n=2 Tax=Streptosporangium TaxID=2000 RepID=A0A852V1M8_9ACTN|nr:MULTISPECIES: hypothetical protein [Streptosporangium]NYF39715.1 hypothetical protein [Streptosporangium sandarakinum]GGP87592.1 hypothetical protein GCM10010140_16220 [Streptosporangium pseudovulgare]
MSPVQKYAIGAAAVIVLALILPLPSVVTWLIILGVVAAPVVGYLMLDPSQRARLRRARRRGIGR